MEYLLLSVYATEKHIQTTEKRKTKQSGLKDKWLEMLHSPPPPRFITQVKDKVATNPRVWAARSRWKRASGQADRTWHEANLATHCWAWQPCWLAAGHQPRERTKRAAPVYTSAWNSTAASGGVPITGWKRRYFQWVNAQQVSRKVNVKTKLVLDSRVKHFNRKKYGYLYVCSSA